LLLLILFGFLTLEQPREAAGNGKLKDHQKLGARTARDYSTTFGAGCKGCSHSSLPISVTTRDSGMEEDSARVERTLAKFGLGHS
jgi:hypothetical protein